MRGDRGTGDDRSRSHTRRFCQWSSPVGVFRNVKRPALRCSCCTACLNELFVQVWQGTYMVPAGRLPAPWHLEAQMVFKGVVGGMERWDNNGGSNWSLAVEVAPGEGLVAALNPSYASTRALVGVRRVPA